MRGAFCPFFVLLGEEYFSKGGAFFIFLWLLGERSCCEMDFCKQTVNIALNRGYQNANFMDIGRGCFSNGADFVNML